MSLVFNCPLNSVSFGQVSTALLREAYEREMDFLIAKIGDKLDLSSQQTEPEFFKKLEQSARDFSVKFDRSDSCFKLWHLNGAIGWLADNQTLMTFYELDDPTDLEINIVKNCRKVIFTSEFTRDLFNSKGLDTKYVPLFFDKHNFKKIKREEYDDNRIVFNLCGKFEFRKHHSKIISAWVKKYGNNKKYLLQCAVYNPFFDKNANAECISSSLNYQRYYNTTFLSHLPKNQDYNKFLNSSDVIIGMSGGEGWGLPEFHSLALGKHAVLLNAHAYKSWANESNAVLVEPSSKVDCVDGKFFHKGQEYNQGQIFDWKEDDFIDACEEAIKRVEASRENTEGLKLQDEFTVGRTLDGILDVVNQ